MWGNKNKRTNVKNAEKILDRGIGYKTSTPEIIMLEAANHYLK